MSAGGVPPKIGGSIPISPGVPVAPEESHSTAGVHPAPATKSIPVEESQTSQTGIHSRQAVPTETVTPQVNALARIKSQYLEQHQQVETLEAQYGFLKSIPDLQQHLLSPETVPTDSLPFHIMFVKGGETTSIIPPDPSLKDNLGEAKKLRDGLTAKLETIKQYNDPEKLEHFESRLKAARAIKERYATAITGMGVTLPKPKDVPVYIPIDAASFTQTPVTPPKPSRITPNTESSPPPEPVVPPKGHFVLRPKATPQEAPIEKQPPAVAPKPKKTTKPQPPVEVETLTAPRAPLPPPIAPSATPITISEKSQSASKRPKIEKTYLSETSHTDGFADIFLKKETVTKGPIASVNAGAIDLHVGGGGINAEFEKLIPGRPKDYQAFHESITNNFADHKDSVHFLTSKDVSRHSNGKLLLASAVMYQPKANGHGDKHQGTVIVEVFKKNYPNDNPQNLAMIYIVPPKGDTASSKEAFLKSVRNTARNTAFTQNKHNQWVILNPKLGLPELTVLRTCMFSGDAYKHVDCSGEEVAKAIQEGFTDFESTVIDCTIKEIQYENGNRQFFSPPPEV